MIQKQHGKTGVITQTNKTTLYYLADEGILEEDIFFINKKTYQWGKKNNFQ